MNQRPDAARRPLQTSKPLALALLLLVGLGHSWGMAAGASAATGRAQSTGTLPQAAAARPQPPKLDGAFRQPDLVELDRLDPTIHLDIRYATTNNFLGRPVYPQARAFLQRPAAQALARVSAALKRAGYGLVVFDGYRPWAITKVFWDVTPADKKKFVADPATGSKHNRGCAVDLSLYDLETGREVEMPSGFDEMSDRAAAAYEGGPQEARRHRDLLRKAMEAEGFEVYADEWWHFDYRDWPKYPILDVPFDAIR